MTTKYITKTILKIDTNGDGTVDTVTQIRNVGPLSENRPMLDVTTLDSTRREYRPGLPDSGELTFEANYDSTSHAALHGLILEDGTATACQLEMLDADGTNESLTFKCWFNEWTLQNFEPDNTVTAAVKAKITDAITGY